MCILQGKSMGFLKGIQYNLRGASLGLRTPSLLFLGLLRLFIILALALFLSGMVLLWHNEILSFVWAMPEPGWILYLWYIVSWLLSIVLMMVAMIVSYFIAQICFCVFIMDHMSRVTEKIYRGTVQSPGQGNGLSLFFHLIRQEVPRAILPVFFSLFIAAVGLLTPAGPIILVLSSMVAAIFLAWDHTDLIQARQMLSFHERLRFLRKNVLFHLGFGVLFLIPWLNIFFLSFAPVGATLYMLDTEN